MAGNIGTIFKNFGVSYVFLFSSVKIGSIEGGQIFRIVASRFVNVSEGEINLMKENAIPRNTKHATKFGMTLFQGKM